MIAARDGVRLNTEIFAPRDVKEPLPFILMRTPYGISGGLERIHGDYLKDLTDDGYIFVFQDIRGRFKSEGQFVMIRPPRDKDNPKAIDEGTDTYDTIEWLLKNVPNNNGRVGMLGISYPGWLTVMAAIEPHPALKAVSPQASPADMFLGDDFHHNGAFRLSYGFEYSALMETDKVNTLFQFDRRDTYEWYLKLGALPNANKKYFHNKLPTWNDFVEHPNYDAFWQKQACAPYLTRVAVPTLNVAGWWDQEDFYGPLKIYDALEPHDKKNMNYLVVGPWNHGGWSSGDGSNLGKIDFGSPTGKYYREKIQTPWFAYYLKDKGNPDFPEARTYRTGSNQWKSYTHWPPKEAKNRNLYFRGDGRLSFDAPKDDGDTAFDSYISDPARPVPYRARPIEPTYAGPGWPVWLVEDQRFVHSRPDVASWETEPLKENVVVTGDIVAHLFASTSGTDSDWIVKLIDVYPDEYRKDPNMSGYQLMIANDVLRGRFRKSFEKPEPVSANEVNEYTVDLHGNDHSFLKGHKIMVQVQSTWFPVIDRNPQTYVENIFKANDSDYKAAEQHVYRSTKFPSHVTLPVMADTEERVETKLSNKRPEITIEKSRTPRPSVTRTAVPANVTENAGIVTERAFGPEITGKYKHPASIAELQNGDLYLVYYGGTGEYTADSAVHWSRLKKGETRWSLPKVVKPRPSLPEGNPVVWQAPDGVVWLFSVVRAGATWCTSRITSRTSKDGGQTWSEPELVTKDEGTMVRAKPIVLANGDYLLPIYHETGNDPERTAPDTCSAFLRYDAKTREWTESNRIKSRVGNLQPAVAAVTDDYLICYCRRGGDYLPTKDGYLVRSSSHDGGKTWSEGKDSSFPNPNAATDFIRLQNGHFLLVYNDSMSERTPLTVAISTDNDKTYPYRRNIAVGRGDFAYPYAIQTSDGKIHVVYTSEHRSVINHAVFDESAILNSKK
jgi:putative CocE/NonD family hydrolase